VRSRGPRPEQVELTDGQERRREPAEVSSTGRRRVRRHVVSTGAVAEDRVPGKEVGLTVPDAKVGDLVARAGLVPVIEHRVVQRLEQRCGQTPGRGP